MSSYCLIRFLKSALAIASVAAIALQVAGWPSAPDAAAQVGPPFPATGVIISGEIERISINNRGDHWSGGVIQVGGQNVIIPRNLLMDLPANRLTLAEIYDQAPLACLLSGETGLAKGDFCNTTNGVPGTGGFALIHANRTQAGNVIAGDVFIQKGIEAVIGTVTYVSYTDGYYRLNGIPNDPATGVMVRLNDPDGRHTVQQGLGCNGGPNCSADPRFTLDPDNYVNAFTTGYPYCIPSTVPRTFTDILGLGATTAQALPDGSGDVLCPQANRPANGPAPDSRRFAPLKVGDPVNAEGNFEVVNGVKFLSAHTTQIMNGLTTSQLPGQPDYFFLDEVGIDLPGFQNERVRTLIIGYSTFAPADVLIWSRQFDQNNVVHEMPLASVQGCDNAAGVGTCGRLAFTVNSGDIFRIRHDIDFLVGAKPKLNPCAQLIADPRMGTGFCPNGGAAELNTSDMLGILSPIPHEIQARTGRKFASLQPGGTPLTTIDVNGNEATNGQYLFPFGIGLGGLSPVEPVEFNLNAVMMPYFFSGIPWNLDRRLSPGGCIDTNGDGAVDCEATPQPLDPFPFEVLDPRIQASVPAGAYNDPNFTASPLSTARNRILSFVDAALGKFNGNNTVLAWPPVDPAFIPISATVPVIGPPVNRAPSALPDAATTRANSAVVIPVLVNDTDPDGNALTVISAGPAANGTVLNSRTSVTYTPNPAFSGTDSFLYTVTDGRGGTSTTAVTVAVGNRAPVAVNDAATTTEDTPVDIAVLLNDTDADPAHQGNLTVIAVNASTSGAVAINSTGVNNTVRYTPALNFSGVASFTYTVADPEGAAASATVTVTVSPVNDAPVAVNDTATTNVGVAVTIPVLANDTDADHSLLTVSATTHGANGIVLNNGTSVTYTPNAGFRGVDTFTYTVSDGLLTATGTVAVTVNAPPVAVNDTGTTNAGTPATISVLTNDTDADGNTLTVTAVGAPAPAGSGAATLTATSVTFTPTPGFSGAVAFPYTISDGKGGIATATVTVTVNANRAPVAVDDTATTNAGTPVTVSVLANDNDADGHTLTVTAVGAVTPGTAGAATFNATSVTFTPAVGVTGAATFTYTISDGNGGTATATVTVTVA
ncbi:MAG: tandem-95 repeat protein [Chloroflexi bacterium]|nr:tandem-95 repeat protein [Chloroflexota bacterium]